MDQGQMDDFFKQVGFVPPEEGGAQPQGQHAQDQAKADASGKSDKGAKADKGGKDKAQADGVHVGEDADWSRGAGAGSGSERVDPSDILEGILGGMLGFGGGARRRKGKADTADTGKGGKDGDQVTVAGIAMPDWSRKAFIVAGIVLLLAVAFLYWWFHPPINIHSQNCWTFGATFILLPLFFLFVGFSRAYKVGTKRRAKNEKKSKLFKRLSYIPLIIAVLGLVGAVAGWSFWPGNAARYSSLLNIQESDFASDIQEVDYNSIPVIDRDSSVLLGNRTLGEIPDYVSQFEISPLYSQINYQNRPVRVSPLNYADVFKWFYNYNTGIPAYVVVDMPSQNAQVVRLEKPIYYSDSDPLFRNIDRHVQLHYPFYMFEQKSFEIDEEGNPWWVCPVQTRTIGLFGGETISRVVLCNASTGECQDVAIDEVPQWVDRAYPSDLLIQQYNWYGSLHNGWLNSWLGQQGVVQTTPGQSGELGYNYIAKDDDVWVYTGVTSATADNAIVGFVLVNQRTAEAHYYSVAGATEDSAMSSAEGQVQNLRYSATFPLLLNINGQPTYFMALKDGAGLVKKFAMLDIQRYQNVAVGDTVAETQKSYKSLLATNGIASQGADSALDEASGIIKNMAQAVIDGNSHIYLTLEDDDHIFDCPLPGLIEIVGYAQGDYITLRYVESTPTSAVQEIEGDGGSSVLRSTSSDAQSSSSSNGQDSGSSSDSDAGQSGGSGN